MTDVAGTAFPARWSRIFGDWFRGPDQKEDARQAGLSFEQRVLKKAAEDALILLAYLSRQKDAEGLGDKQVDYVAIPRKVLSGSFDDKDMAALYDLLRELMKRAAPATPESIMDSRYARRLGLTQRRARGYGMTAVLVVGFLAFGATFVLGLYVSLTDIVIADQQAGTTEYSNIVRGKFDNTRLAFLDDPKPVGDGSSGSSSEQPSAPSSELDQAGQPSAEPPQATADDKNATTSDEQDYALDVKRQIALESKWRRSVLMGTTAPFTWLVPAEVSDADPKQLQLEQPSAFEERLIKRQIYVNKIITGFFLPISAALTGAMVFVMRDRGRREDNTTLEVRDSRRYVPRLVLATVAGIIVGWFSGRDSSGILATLTPAAAAFIVGYSTEIFFNLLDSIKTALGVKDA